MSKCCVKGCRSKGNIQFQTRRWSSSGKLESWDLCYAHGFYMTRKDIEFEIDRNVNKATPGKSYVQKAKMAAYDEKTTHAITSNKDNLTLSNYLATTGKRFRMTKDQKFRKLSREDAFTEFMESIK